MKTIETRVQARCPRCDYTQVEGAYTVIESKDSGFWLGFLVATVVSVALRLLGWVG